MFYSIAYEILKNAVDSCVCFNFCISKNFNRDIVTLSYTLNNLFKPVNLKIFSS